MGIGYHLAGTGLSLREELNDCPDGCAYQFFSNRFQVKHQLQLGRRQLFIHGPYTVNLSNDQVKLGSLIKDLKLGQRLGCSGVVVHVGKYVDRSPRIGLNNMHINIQELLQHASDKCPLLVETPAGQGTEMLTDIDQFIRFYKRYQVSSFKICIDTCHVFALGYDPLEYILRVEQECGSKAIALIHYNDSKEPKGSHKDRHARIGQGYISLEVLQKIHQWALKNQIPLVKE